MIVCTKIVRRKGLRSEVWAFVSKSPYGAPKKALRLTFSLSLCVQCRPLAFLPLLPHKYLWYSSPAKRRRAARGLKSKERRFRLGAMKSSLTVRATKQQNYFCKAGFLLRVEWWVTTCWEGFSQLLHWEGLKLRNGCSFPLVHAQIQIVEGNSDR